MLERVRDVALQRIGRAPHEQSDGMGGQQIVSGRYLPELLGELPASVRIPDKLQRNDPEAEKKRQRQGMLQGSGERKTRVQSGPYAPRAALHGQRRSLAAIGAGPRVMAGKDVGKLVMALTIIARDAL